MGKERFGLEVVREDRNLSHIRKCISVSVASGEGVQDSQASPQTLIQLSGVTREKFVCLSGSVLIFFIVSILY